MRKTLFFLLMVLMLFGLVFTSIAAEEKGPGVVAVEPTACEDSDGGNEPYVAGKVVGEWGDKVKKLEKDHCYALRVGEVTKEIEACPEEDVEKGQCYLREFYCDGKERKSEPVKCEFGCRAGACLKNITGLIPAEEKEECPPECKEGQYRCDMYNQYVTFCVDDNVWAVIVGREDYSKYCVAPECLPSEFVCEDDKVKVCKSGFWVTGSETAYDTYCKEKVCTKGEYKCNVLESYVALCKEDGTWYPGSAEHFQEFCKVTTWDKFGEWFKKRFGWNKY